MKPKMDEITMSKENSLHMSSAEFRNTGYAVIDWIADYYEKVDSYPVLSQVKPGDIRSSLPDTPPQSGESMNKIINDVNQLIMPGITHWQSPNFYGYFPCNASGPAILADLLSSGLGINGMLWTTSPACTELETHVLDWLADMLDLPKHFKSTGSGGGVIQDTASSSSLCALIASRERATKGRSNKYGCKNKLTAYASNQSHSSIEKAVIIAGLGKNNMRLIDVDESFAMRSENLKVQIEQDIKDGFTPAYVCATVGTTSSTAFDPLKEIGRICRQYNLWLHVDAAMAGTAALCPEYRYVQEGLEFADSYTFNPHKWMLTNFDCSCLYVADRSELINSLSISPEYLKNQATQSGAVFDYRDWQIPLGRRFRSLKLWSVIRYYGVEGLRKYIRKHVELAQEFASWVEDDDRFQLMAPVPLNLVCFRYSGSNEFNKMILDNLNQSGDLFLTHTKLNEYYTLRICIGQTRTTIEHVDHAWKMIKKTAEKLETRSKN